MRDRDPSQVIPIPLVSGTFLQSVVNADPEADWIPYMIPMKEEDQKVTPGVHMCTSRWFVVSKECKKPEALIQLMNLYCEKTMDPERNEYEIYSNPGNIQLCCPERR